MDNNNPIKYSDLIAPDNSIEVLIKQLNELDATYKDMAKTIKSEASQISESLKGSKGAPSADATRQIQQTDKLARAYQELSFAESENAKRLAEVNAKRQEATRIAKLEEQFHRSAIGSYDRLSAQYSLNKIRLNAMSKAMRENAEVGKALEKQTREIYEEMNRLQVATGKHTLNVGNYTSAFNGLGVATQQIVRELPSLAISANTFFLAISNNIPILVDQINMMRAANKAALAEGKPTTSILKGIVGSLLSWQTALVLGITLLSQHGGKVIEWVKQLFNGKEALDITAEAAKNFNEAMQQGAVDAVSETTKLDLLYNAATNSALSMERRRAAAEELQRMYPDYLGNMSSEQIMLGQAVAKYQELTTAVIKYAEAKAAENQIIENATTMQKIANEMDIETLRTQKDQIPVLQARLNSMNKYVGDTGQINPEYQQLSNQIAEYAKNSEEIVKALELPKQYKDDVLAYYDVLEATNSKLAEIATQGIGANPSGSGKVTTPQTNTSKAAKDTEDQYKRLVEARRDYEDQLLGQEEDGYEKRRQQLIYQYDREIEDLRHALNTQKDLTVEEREIMNAQILLAEANLGRDLDALAQDQSLSELEQQQKGIDLRLRAVEEGSEAEYELLLERNRVALQIALAKNALLAEAERQSVADIIAAFDAEFAKIVGSRTADIEADTEKAAEQKAKEIATAFNVAKGAISEFSKNSSEAIESMRSIFNMPLGDDGKTLADKLGLSQPALESMSMVAGSVIGMLQDIAAARVEEADKAVEASRREIDAARDALQAEIAARNEGYAHNVAQARKELELAKRTEKQALAEKQRAQRQQLVMDSISQASNLVTASALVWAQLGFPWAIAAIGSMFASFAASKILAARATRESYGDGTVELLHGGSHQSGNDIDLGTKPDGTRRRAEGGEYFAVFNKRASRNRGALITDVVNSLNNGTFAQKYQRAYDMGGGLMLNVGGTSPDLRRLSDDVRKIKEQNERRTYLDSEGNVVEVYKNVKRVIKKC